MAGEVCCRRGPVAARATERGRRDLCCGAGACYEWHPLRRSGSGEAHILKRRGLLAASGTLLAAALAKASERVARATDNTALVVAQANSSTLETSLNRTGNSGPITFHVSNSQGGALLAECTSGICGDFSNSAGGGALRAVCAAGGVPITGGFTSGSTPTNPAVLGSNPGPGPGVQGGTTSGTGVLGQAGSGVGVQGISSSNVGVLGNSTSSVGVYAQLSSSTGLYATSTSGAGIVASTNGGNAIQGASNGNVGVLGTSNTSIGGFFASATSTGLFASGPASAFAARFDGPVQVNGAFTVVGGPKSAAAPHPDGSYRRLYCVESPESWF